MGLFEDSYEGLNEAQKAAVDTIDGPLLVIAGPGTGKTQLLAVRAANILHKTDASAYNLLCLTFTNKAATNMRERLLELIGPAARGIVVRTFHSFAAEIMNRYPDYFWNGAKLVTAPDSIQLELIQAVLSELPLDHPLALKFAGQYTLTSDVQSAIRLTKEAGLTPEKLRAVLEYNIRYIDIVEPILVSLLEPNISTRQIEVIEAGIQKLPDHNIDQTMAPLSSLDYVIKESFRVAQQEAEAIGKNKPISAWKSRWIQNIGGQKGMHEERKRNKWWCGVADAYEKYRDALNKRGFYDYSDMVIEVITQLEAHPDLLASVQDQFTYVMIDEFQDTNTAQLRLAHLVADHYSANGRPNIMAVGDDDQSIFKFQGAELNNMLNFRQDYTDVKVIVLTENYRSTQAILETARQIVEQAEYRLVTLEPDISKNLVAVQNSKPSIIRHEIYPTQEHQYSGIVRTITNLYETTDSVAVLARSHESLRNIAAELINNGVAVRYEQQTNILEDDLVVQVTTLAELVIAIAEGNEDSVNALLATSLRHPMWRIDSRKLWDYALANYREPHWLKTILDDEDSAVQNIGHWLLWLSSLVSVEHVRPMLDYLIGLRAGEHLTSPVREYFAVSRGISHDYMVSLSALRLLRSMTTEFGNENAKLADFVELIQTQAENKKVIADETPFVSGSRAVHLMTVHKAKGLEFDSVIIVDAVEQSWQPNTSGRKPPSNLPLRPHGDNYDDYVRLMYVAATRAKNNLVVSSYTHDTRGDEVLATPLIQYGFEIQKNEQVTEQENKTVLESAIRWPRLESNNEKLLLASRLENYKLSATHLLSFIDVINGGPQHFFEKYLLRLPEHKSATLTFGSAIHNTLEAMQISVNKGNAFDPNIALTTYEGILKTEPLTRAEFDRYLPHGQGVLKRLFTDLGYELAPGNYAEKSINDTQVGEACIRGKLDLLIIDSDSISIADYKTGKPLSNIKSKAQIEGIKALKQRLQLTFYSMLVNNSSDYAKYVLKDCQIIYVEAETPKDLKINYVPSPADLENLEKLIQAVWMRIQNLDMPDISSYEKTLSGIEKFCSDLINNAV